VSTLSTDQDRIRGCEPRIAIGPIAQDKIPYFSRVQNAAQPLDLQAMDALLSVAIYGGCTGGDIAVSNEP
jgi:hypothetical protein